jgi:hypothetical protein
MEFRFAVRYTDGYYVVFDTEANAIVPSPRDHRHRYRDGYLWPSSAMNEARRLEESRA